jgi:flagellar biogenesis protein FliO
MADIATSAASSAASAASGTAAALAGLETPLWPELAITVGSLLLVLVLAWLLLRWLRRSQTGGAARDGPRVMRSVALGTRERLVVVEHHGIEYLLGVTAASVSVIERREPDASPERIEPTL